MTPEMDGGLLLAFGCISGVFVLVMIIAAVTFLEKIAKELKRIADLEEAAIKEEKERRQ